LELQNDLSSQVLRREQWAIDRSATGPLTSEEVKFLLVHHSASANDYVEEDVPRILQGFFDYHTSPEKGWPDIAYNLLIDRFGHVWEGRTGSIAGPVAGDATGGNQGFSQLVCLIGDFSIEFPSQSALDALVSTLAWLAERDGVATAQDSQVSFVSRGSNRWPAGAQVTTATIAGHRDMSITTCPGDKLYPYVKGDLVLDVDRRKALADSATTTTELEPRSPTTSETTMQTIPAANTTIQIPETPAVLPVVAGPEYPSANYVRGLALASASAMIGLIIGRRIALARGKRAFEKSSQRNGE